MRLKELRELKGITQQEVADAIGGTQSNYAKWEKEKIQPAADAIIKLSDFFQVSTDFLLGRSDDFGQVTVQSPAPALLDEETALLELYRKMTKAQRLRFIAYGEGITGASAPKYIG